MLTASEKLSIILEYKKLTTNDIANRLDINRSAVSQWKNDNSKFKKIHMYAISSAFNIPINIFFDNSINSKEKVIKYLNEELYDTENRLIDDFIGKWYLYFYSHIGDKLNQFEIEVITANQIIIKNEEILYIGKLDFIKKHIVIKAYCKKYTSGFLILTFNISRILDGIFNVGILTKTLISFRYIAAFGIISKDRLEEKKIKYILGAKSENFLLNKIDKRDKIINIYQNTTLENIYDSYYIFNNIIGKWHFYRADSTLNIYFIIDNSFTVKMYRDEVLVSKGKIEINTFTTQFELIDFKNRIDHFIFKSNDNDIKVCCYKSNLYSTDTNIMGIGLISKKPLDKEFLDKFFNSKEKHFFNIDEYHYKLLKLL